MAHTIEEAAVILGTACGRCINALVTGSITALRILRTAHIHCQNSREKE